MQAGQVHDGLSCAAVPVRSPDGLLVAAVVVTVRGTDPEPLAGYVESMGKAAARLGPLLG